LQGRLSLQERLAVLVLAAMAPLAALSVWFAAHETGESARRAEASLAFSAGAVAAWQDRIIDSVHHLLGAVVAMPQLLAGDPAACRAQLGALQQRFPLYANFGVADAKGRVVCLARGDLGNADASDRLYFRRAVAQRTFVMGEPVIGRATGTHLLAFALPLQRPDGELAGVAFAALDLRRAEAALRELELPAGTRVTVAASTGQALMVHPPLPSRAPGGQISVARLREVAAAMQEATGEIVGPEGEPRLFAAAPTRAVAGERLIAIVTQDLAGVTAPADRQLLTVLAATALSVLAGLALAWAVGGRFILKPAKQILGTVRRIEQGRLDARVPMAPGHLRGEFARLAAAFNLMAESLQMRQLDLEAELGRSRAAYDVLDMVLNSMQEALVAVDAEGRILMHNRAAAHVFPIDGMQVSSQGAPGHFGLHHPGTQAPYPAQHAPNARALRGESGEMLVLVRNERVPQGRMLRCNFSPMQGGDRPRALLVFTDVTELERAEADLVLLRNAVARLNDIVVITEAEPVGQPGPRIVFTNEAFERLTGYSAREAIGSTPRMLQGPGTDRGALDRIREALEQRRPVREELLNYTKDGRELWLEVDIVPLADEAGRFTHFIAVQRDITARKQFETRLMERERELQEFSSMLQRTAEAAQAITRHQALDHTLQEVVDQARSVIGAHQAVISLSSGGGSQSISAVSMSDKFGEWPAPPMPLDGSGIYAVVLETGRPLRLTHEALVAHPRFRNFARAGKHPPLRGLMAVPLVNTRGESIGLLQLSDKYQGEFSERDEYVAIELAQLASIALENARLFDQIRDLNASLESRIAERTAELVRQGRLYRTLAEQLPEVVWNTDATGSHLTFLNRAWYDLVGGTENDWIGKSGLGAIHPDDREEVAANWMRSRDTLASFTGIRRVRARDGSYHTMSYKASPVFDENSQVAFWVGIDADITSLKMIEEALRASNQELEAFSYSVSHDLRAPLGAIGGFSQALAGRIERLEDEKARHYLARIQAGVQKMEQLIEALLGLSRVAREPLRLAPVDLSALAREAVEGLQVQQPQRHVDVRVQDGLVAQGDARLLRILLENLLGNAWKFTSKAAEPRIEVGKLPQEPRTFYVRDNGVGFDMNYADKLFSAFQRLHTEAEFPGTGIGLATVRRIVSRHQGKVWAESAPGQGTTFYFTLDAG
jgi:PAS domain S-box-containing protein